MRMELVLISHNKVSNSSMKGECGLQPQATPPTSNYFILRGTYKVHDIIKFIIGEFLNYCLIVS